jgi:hypothetical protein
MLVPPTQRFDRNADLFQGSLGLLNLDLLSPVSQEEGHAAIK